MKKILSFLGALFLLIGISVDANADATAQLLLVGDTRSELKDAIFRNMVENHIFDCQCKGYWPGNWKPIETATMHKEFENEDLTFSLYEFAGLDDYFNRSMWCYARGSDVVVYACSSNDIGELCYRLGQINARKKKECKVILVLSPEVATEVQPKLPHDLSNRLSEDNILVVDSSNLDEIRGLAERMLNLAYEAKNNAQETASTSGNKKTCLLL